MPCENTDHCPLMHRIKTLEEDNTHNKSSHEKIYDRLNAIERANGVTQVQFEKIMETVKDIKEDLTESIKEIKAGMKALESQPGQNWKTLINALIVASGGGIIGFIVSKIFGG